MNKGYLSQYFDGVAAKRLSAVEADILCSHQHEFNGVKDLKDILGEPPERIEFSARFLYLTDDSDPVVEDGFLTWYDARRKARLKRSVMRWEYRLYFPTNAVSAMAELGDLLVVAKMRDGNLLALVVPQGSTIESQIIWLFGFGDLAQQGFSVKSEFDTEHDRVGLAARIVLDQIGVETEEEATDYLEEMKVLFDGRFPKTSDFSKYARGTLPEVSSMDDPDAALLAWMEREEVLYRALENYLLLKKLRGLVHEQMTDCDPAIRAVQSTLQRRKSRAGAALENHLEQIFTDRGITYTRGGVTENRLKPDFIFPGINSYRDTEFPQGGLSMLASKSTCKDRWRQILNEAARIPEKHLLTLEPSISENQTNEMRLEMVRLVIPKGLHPTYTVRQQSWLMDLEGFTSLVKERQRA